MRLLLLLLLLVPGWHQIRGHNAYLRTLRIFQPGTVVPETEHEQHHQMMNAYRRAVATGGWLAFSALVIILAFS